MGALVQAYAEQYILTVHLDFPGFEPCPWSPDPAYEDPYITTPRWEAALYCTQEQQPFDTTWWPEGPFEGQGTFTKGGIWSLLVDFRYAWIRQPKIGGPAEGVEFDVPYRFRYLVLLPEDCGDDCPGVVIALGDGDSGAGGGSGGVGTGGGGYERRVGYDPQGL